MVLQCICAHQGDLPLYDATTCELLRPPELAPPAPAVPLSSSWRQYCCAACQTSRRYQVDQVPHGTVMFLPVSLMEEQVISGGCKARLGEGQKGQDQEGGSKKSANALGC